MGREVGRHPQLLLGRVLVLRRRCHGYGACRYVAEGFSNMGYGGGFVDALHGWCLGKKACYSLAYFGGTV